MPHFSSSSFNARLSFNLCHRLAWSLISYHPVCCNDSSCHQDKYVTSGMLRISPPAVLFFTFHRQCITLRHLSVPYTLKYLSSGSYILQASVNIDCFTVTIFLFIFNIKFIIAFAGRYKNTDMSVVLHHRQTGALRSSGIPNGRFNSSV